MTWAKLKKVSYQPSHVTIFNSIVVLFLLVWGGISAMAQNGEVVVFSENWDNSTELEPWKPNITSGWFQEYPKNQIVSQSGKGNVLKVNFDAGDISGMAGMGNYRVYLDSMYKELYFSWEYYLDPNFDYGFTDGEGGGKFFGGFSGGNHTNVPYVASDTSVGWTYFMMFHDGEYFTYPYFYNHEYWDGYPAGNNIAPIVKGTWREITIRLRVNDPNMANGFVEMFDNGKLVFRKTDYQMTSPAHPEWLIDALLLNTFFGGPSPSPKAQYAMFDNMVAWYYPKSSSFYRAGTSESGRLVYAPRVTNYHPRVPNKFTETTYTDARGTITSHCGFAMPINLEDVFQTSTIQISGASWITLNVSKFDYNYSSYSGSGQILRIYSGTGANRTLVKTVDQNNPNVPTSVDIASNSATIEWQAGKGDRMGFNLTYSSDGTGSGKNFTCGNFTAVQNGSSQITTPVTPPVTPPSNSDYIPKTPTNLASTSITGNSVAIKWTDNSFIEDWYEVERTGPTTSQNKTIKVSANVTTYLDYGLSSNTNYTYKVRAYNSIGGYSAYSGSLAVKTLAPAAPLNPPSKLASIGYTDKSITIEWSDNSTNESGFIVTRTLANVPDSTVDIMVEANTTNFTDDSLSSNTTYIYTVKAVNNTGTSASSNKNIASTLSVVETKRVMDGLIAYYNFSFSPEYVVYDLSGYDNPLDLRILQPNAVKWNENNRLEILSGTAIVSNTTANKVISEIKRTREITMECWIRPAEPNLSLNSRVISLAINDSEIGFILDQQYNNLQDEKSLNYSVRLQTESTTKSGYPEIAQLSGITYLNMQHVVYIRDSLGNEKLYVNSEKVSEGFRPSDFSTWNNNFFLRLGNENDLTHPWKGTFYSLAIYNKALSVNEINKNYALGPSDNIKSKGLDFKINVYPNPISDLANLEISPVEAQDYIPETFIQLLDMNGKVYYRQTLFNPNADYRTTLDFQNFASGIYFLQIISGQRQKAAKLVVQ